jgi:hypothetical protein
MSGNEQGKHLFVQQLIKDACIRNYVTVTVCIPYHFDCIFYGRDAANLHEMSD